MLTREVSSGQAVQIVCVPCWHPFGAVIQIHIEYCDGNKETARLASSAAVPKETQVPRQHSARHCAAREPLARLQRRIRPAMAATASSSSVDAFFALLEVWEFGQASFLAARLRGRQMRLSASLQQLAHDARQEVGRAFGQLAPRRLQSALAHACGCPEPRPVSASQPRWPCCPPGNLGLARCSAESKACAAGLRGRSGWSAEAS